jgi:hypothetical protein
MDAMDWRCIDKWRRRSLHCSANKARRSVQHDVGFNKRGSCIAPLLPARQPAICPPAGERRCGARRRRRTHVEPDWCNQLPSSANAGRGADVTSDVSVAP